ncbi:hypothetical protein GCM10011511_58000 [Puia dinghuensis]|uniref:SH3b domain-containing protein n=2 Tax=Puia dinghuensis TaxID=1792502 RepID=A0A8J2UJC1_9BACT|nr:hypothetical protein GCM10011511_58000 [Puia dinghuensis]
MEQFAIIADKDGYSNIRIDTGLGSKINDTLHNSHFIYCFEPKGRWISINYSTKKRDQLYGYVFHDRIKLISDYEKIPRISKDKYLFGKDSLKVEVTAQPFVRAHYRLTHSKENPGTIDAINGKQYWGTDGELPKTAYKSITITWGEREMVLPQSAIEDLFEPSLHNTAVNYDRKNDILYIHSENSDGAGAYDVIWKVEKGVYTERYIAYGF